MPGLLFWHAPPGTLGSGDIPIRISIYPQTNKQCPHDIPQKNGWLSFFPNSNCRPLERNSEQQTTA